MQYNTLLVGVLCVVVGFLIRKFMAESKVNSAEEMAKKIVEEAEQHAKTRKKEAELEGKDILYKSRLDFDKESRFARKEQESLSKRLENREGNLDRKLSLLDKKENSLFSKEKEVEKQKDDLQEKHEKYKQLIRDEKRVLEKISSMSSEDAKKLLMKRMEGEAAKDAAKYIKSVEEQAKETADRKAKEIITFSIQRCAAEQVVETTVSVVDLPNNEMKGRIIGREGRNIRALETATGVDLIIDDTPEAVILSGYDSIRREIAKTALERLILNGRIHPARIEEVVEKVRSEMDITIRETGEQVAFDIGIASLHPEIIKLLGRLKYRTSYAQNVLQHSKEVALLAGSMAAELRCDVTMAKRAGLLHDIGKAIDHDIEGTHAQLGADFAKKYNESSEIVNAIAAHHDDEEQLTLEAVLVQAADTLSAARPGARRESLENYIKRLEKLEDIAESFYGVEKTYAIQAGREIRVIVSQDSVSDIDVSQLSRDLARKIENEVEYPGQIKVTVIREVRSVEYAR